MINKVRETIWMMSDMGQRAILDKVVNKSFCEEETFG